MDNLISIIIPAYNIENYLCTTLDSVIAQTYTNIEVIVVNDGSTDGTGAVIDRYAAMDNRIRAIHKENGGVTSARLRGVEAASGKWIGFVDGDDFIEPQMYQQLLNNALKYHADISHCGYQMVFPNRRTDNYYNSGRIVEQDGIQGCCDLLSGSFIEPGLVNKLYRRELFGGLSEWMDPDIRINEDLLMNYYLFKQAATSVFEDVCPYHYVLRKGSAATSALNEHKLWDPLRVARTILADAPEAAEPVIYQKMIRILISGATMDPAANPGLVIPYRSQTRQELRKRLWEVLKSKTCGTKLKAMALWAAVWPASYSWVHQVYMRVTGLDKKYDVN